MRATKYFANSSDMAQYAQQFRQQNKQNNSYFRTFLKCDHRMNEQRKAMLLVDNETIVQRIITCKVCHAAQNPNTTTRHAK